MVWFQKWHQEEYQNKKNNWRKKNIMAFHYSANKKQAKLDLEKVSSLKHIEMRNIQKGVRGFIVGAIGRPKPLSTRDELNNHQPIRLIRKRHKFVS